MNSPFAFSWLDFPKLVHKNVVCLVYQIYIYRPTKQKLQLTIPDLQAPLDTDSSSVQYSNQVCSGLLHLSSVRLYRFPAADLPRINPIANGHESSRKERVRSPKQTKDKRFSPTYAHIYVIGRLTELLLTTPLFPKIVK